MNDDNFPKKVRDIRQKHNQELIRRMRQGEALCQFDSTASWFPPRPIIKKDKRELSRLYGNKLRDAKPATAEASAKNVVELPFQSQQGPMGEAG